MKQFLASVSAVALPSLALAQNAQVGTLIRNILNFFGDVVDFAGPFLIAVALLAFFVSLIRFLFDKDKTQDSKQFLIWSIGILFVMVSIWGIIQFFQENIGLKDGSDVIDRIPAINIGNVRN